MWLLNFVLYSLVEIDKYVDLLYADSFNTDTQRIATFQSGRGSIPLTRQEWHSKRWAERWPPRAAMIWHADAASGEVKNI